MTDRYSGLAVTLTEDLREDDAAELINAIVLMRGVASVEGVRTDVTARMTESSRIRRAVAVELFEMAQRIGSGDMP